MLEPRHWRWRRACGLLRRTHPTVFQESLGFLAVEGVTAGRQDSVSFFRPSDGVAVFDTHGENFLSEGTHVTPIDAFIVRAGAALARLPDNASAGSACGSWAMDELDSGKVAERALPATRPGVPPSEMSVGRSNAM